MFPLIQQLNESIHDKGKLKAVFVCGSPGAGKSYTIDRIKDGTIEPRIINSDKIYEFLDNHKGLIDTSDPNSWHGVRDTIVQTLHTQLFHYVNGMLPMFIDSTSANPSAFLRRAGILESLGYDVGLVWIDVDVDTAMERARERKRNVPEDFIQSVHDNIEQSKAFIMSKFDWVAEIDNNDGMLTDQVIQEAYKVTTSFFNAPVSNPIGKSHLDKLEKAKQSYLIPTIYSKEQISHMTTAWYNRK